MNKKICESCKHTKAQFKYTMHFVPGRIKYVFFKINENEPCFELYSSEMKSYPTKKNMDKWVEENITDDILRKKCRCFTEQCLYEWIKNNPDKSY